MQKSYTILKFLIILQILAQTTYALDPMYEYRYTLGPEILVPDAFHVGTGFYTRRNADIRFIVNSQIQLIDQLEFGFKYLGGTKDDWVLKQYVHDQKLSWHMINFGVKFALNQHLTLQADIPIALNRDWDWGGVLSITKFNGYARNLSFLSEFRLGFGGAAGEDSYVKPAAAFVPNFQIGQSFRVSIGTIASFSFENSANDLMLDILPKVEVGIFEGISLTGEVAIGILTWDAERYNRYAVFIMTKIL